MWPPRAQPTNHLHSQVLLSRAALPRSCHRHTLQLGLLPVLLNFLGASTQGMGVSETPPLSRAPGQPRPCQETTLPNALLGAWRPGPAPRGPALAPPRLSLALTPLTYSLFPQHTRLRPAPGPLHQPFPWPGTCFPGEP